MYLLVLIVSMGVRGTLANTFLFMEDLKIETYEEQLKQVCSACKREEKCKDKNKICMFKKYVFLMSKRVYKRRVKKGQAV